MSEYPKDMVLGVIACAGEFPRKVIDGAHRAGVRVVAAGMRGAVGPEIPGMSDAYKCFRVGSIEGPADFFVQEGVTHVMLTGQIKPSCIYTMWPDAMARKLLKTLDRRNAHTIFTTVCNFIESRGMKVLPSITFMEDQLPAAGHIAGPAPTAGQMDEARFGLGMAREIARLDIGQSIIVHGHQVLCVEAFKGTNECLHAGGHRPHGVTLCKVTKPGHDMRFDVPCIGTGTIRNAIKAHVNHIVFEAHRTILFQREEVARMCNEHGITLHAMDVPLPEQEGTDPGHILTDAAHAAAMAAEIKALGIGCCAVVCDGVVIAVDDADGPLKCIRRAAAYMKRLRLARLLNWLGRILLGRPGTPPVPMVLASTRPLTAEEERAARKAGIHVIPS
ncbi:MAG: UDP-2,3-diacylglucosamine diphosphatase LpxI [Akkermansia sp.]|nr:UDP-2,3-diacylglucosamine diphosphatase LpxI [Akkermansia sp.]